MNSKFFALVGIFLSTIVLEPTIAARLEQGRLDERPNYVVIGAFKVYKNAIRFTARAHKGLNMDVKFEMNPYRNLYYVYVLSTENQDLAIHEAKRLRSESEFTDTWVYFGTLGDKATELGQDIHPITEEKIDEIAKSDTRRDKNMLTPIDSVISEPKIAVAENTAEDKMKSLDEAVVGKNFFFKVFRAVDNVTIDGDVDAIDTEKTRKIGTYKANTPVKITNNKLNQVSFVCEVFGYRKLQKDINYNNPEADGVAKDENGAAVIPFELVRLQKGDIAVMYNVYFFKDAAIMRPESRFEVNSLLDMLNENPKYKIKLHGHTNGNAAGKIISMTKDSDNFFSLSKTKDGFGSAKQLSEERADVIRSYMISKGIDPSRMEVRAWGGKRPLQDKHSPRAQENVRVEVEILED
jgi:outer membrane protein OmpA-like peptidoglycan-associated protein